MSLQDTRCMCGDTDCPSCGTAQGTYEDEDSVWPVSVVEPCNCPNCAAGKRWFYCQDIREIAEYDIIAEVQPQEDWEEIKQIREMHPGKTLIY